MSAALFDRRGRRKYLNALERRAFLRVVENEPDLLRKTFGLTLFYTGCRISEALNLTRDGVDVAGLALIFETLKQRRRGIFRSVPIPDELVRLLRGVLSVTNNEVWHFSRTTAFRFVKSWMADAEIEGGMACPKGLRHGFAVACVDKAVPLTTLQKWMGHSRLETTAIYLNVNGEEERSLAKRLW